MQKPSQAPIGPPHFLGRRHVREAQLLVVVHPCTRIITAFRLSTMSVFVGRRWCGRRTTHRHRPPLAARKNRTTSNNAKSEHGGPKDSSGPLGLSRIPIPGASHGLRPPPARSEEGRIGKE